MDYTTNYQLPIWVETDRILMDDFNDSYQKIETALTDHGNAMEGFGNCQIYTTSYVGTGGSSSHQANSLIFPRPPILLFISTNSDDAVLVVNPNPKCSFLGDNGMTGPYFLWDGCGVSWYASDSRNQMNGYNDEYLVLALLAAEK